MFGKFQTVVTERAKSARKHIAQTRTYKKRCSWTLAIAVCLSQHNTSVLAKTICGERVTLHTHGRSTTAYSIAIPPPAVPHADRKVLVLLPGGSGFLDLDAKGCPRRLKGNSLVRSRDLFLRAGFITVLVDAPSDYQGKDGLAGFRISAQHAEDIGKVIAAVRTRTQLPVWLVGTSRGTISAASAASRLAGQAAPDGLVLTSPVTSGKVGGRKPWVAQTVFTTRLGAIRQPLLVIAHAADTCIRTPPGLAGRILKHTKAVRDQFVTVARNRTGGGRRPSLHACRGRSAHGFLGHEAVVAEGIARFINGGRY